MRFTRYQNNSKVRDGEKKIQIAFDKDATQYNENIQIQDQLKKIKLYFFGNHICPKIIIPETTINANARGIGFETASVVPT